MVRVTTPMSLLARMWPVFGHYEPATWPLPGHAAYVARMWPEYVSLMATLCPFDGHADAVAQWL